MKLIKQLETLKSNIDKTIANVKKNEKQILINELIEECKRFDESYKEYCEEVDDMNKLEIGTTYSRDNHLKYVTEADLWHNISLILRKLEELNNK